MVRVKQFFRYFLFLFLVLSFAPGATHGASLGTVTNLRSNAGSDYTRITIELSRTATYKYGSVPADHKKKVPARFYIDLENVRLDSKKKLDTWVGDSRVKRVRTGQNTLDKARVVIELEGSVTPTITSLKSPPRIVIDLKSFVGDEAKKSPPKSSPKPKAAASPKKPELVKKSGPSPGKITSTVVKAAPKSVVAKPTTKPAVLPKPTPIAKPVERDARVVSKIEKVPGQLVKAPAAKASGSSVSSSSRSRKPRIVLDPGHGGKDPGAKGYRSALEKDSVFDISKRLAAKLKSGIGADVHMTRSTDEFVPLGERKDLANRVDADVFISVHANASKNRSLHGFEVYYLKNTNDRATLRLANLENGVDQLIEDDVASDADLSYIISDMVQGRKEAESVMLANYINKALGGYLTRRYHSVQGLGVKQGPFLVLDGTYMPSVLVEVGFITNSVEGRRLMSSAYRDAVAEGLFQGIRQYLDDERATAHR